MNQRYVSTLYIECQICTYIRKWYIQLLGIRTSISKNNIPFCRLNDREKKFTVTVTETPFEKAILFSPFTEKYCYLKKPLHACNSTIYFTYISGSNIFEIWNLCIFQCYQLLPFHDKMQFFFFALLSNIKL